MFLDADDFKRVVASTPLVSIDLVIENSRGELLLGERKNRPAQYYWFVPGGRIRKRETLDNAFRRIAASELNLDLTRRDTPFLGLFEHFYDDSVFGQTPDTHYVVLSHYLRRDLEGQGEPDEQHSAMRWWGQEELMESPSVHPYTKAYVEALRAKVEKREG